MSPEDVALCQKAIDLANSGQKQTAYKQFCLIRSHGNTEDVTLLYWIAATTPSLEEAQRALDTIARIEPDHPKLQAFRAYVDRKEERQYQQLNVDGTKRFIVWIASASFARCIHEGKNFRKAVEVYSAQKQKKTPGSRIWIEAREYGGTTRLLNIDAEVMDSPSEWWLL
jgi:hypothetical protein